MKNLTRQQLQNASLIHKYMILRYRNGSCIAINSKVTRTKKPVEKLAKNPHKRTNFISFKPCSFMEYISLKTPFI